MKPIFKQVILWASTLVVSTGVAFASFYDYSGGNQTPNSGANNGSQDNNGGNNNQNLSPAQRLLNSLITLDEAEIDGGIEVTFDNKTANINVDGALGLDTENLNNTRFEGSLDVKVNGVNFYGDINYFNGKIFLDYEKAKLFLETSSLLEFVNMIPNYGIDLSLPEELTKFDLNKVMNDLSSMEPEAINGGYLFKLSLNEDIDLVFKSDENYNFVGVKTNKFYFKNTYIYLDFDINQELDAPLTFTEPDIKEYQDFSPTFDLINGIYNAFNRTNNTFNLDVNITNLNNPYIKFNGDLSYDTELSRLSFDGSVIEENHDHRTHAFKLGMQDDNLLVNYNNLKFKVENQSIFALIDYILKKVEDNYLNEALAGMNDILQNSDILGIIDNLSTINNTIKKIESHEDSLIITLDLTVLGINATDIKIALNFDTQTFKGISITGLDVNGYKANINLTTKEYSPISFNMDEYVAIDPAFGLVNAFEGLSRESRFRLDFTGSVDDTSSANQDLSVDGGLQFDINNKFGYGELNLVDPSTYNHNIKVDMRSYDEILFTYNDVTKGRFSSNFFTDVIGMVSEILNNKDDHFYELFGDLLNSMGSLPIMEAINDKDYGKLFEIGLIDSLNVTSNSLELGLKGGLIGIDSTLKVVIEFDNTVENPSEILKSLEVKDFKYGDSVYSFKINLNKYNDALDKTRLDPSDTYIEFDSLAVLLRLGINTSIYNHYHFSGAAHINVDLGIAEVDKDIPIDVKILNEKGNVSLAIEFPNVPTIPLVNNGYSYQFNVRNRRASFYMKDGMFYIHRIEQYDTLPLFGKEKTYETYVKADLDNFLDNIVTYLCRTILGFNDLAMSLVGSGNSDSGSSDSIIHYENLLKDFSYNDSSDTPYFNFGLNLAELTKMDMFSDLNLKVFVDNETNETSTLSGIDVKLNINVLLTIALGAKLDLVNLGEEFTLDEMNSYVTAHSGDELNKIYEQNY